MIHTRAIFCGGPGKGLRATESGALVEGVTLKAAIDRPTLR
jgi:hypothetical protein